MNNEIYSNNVSSADNQQERLIKLGWIIGFVDGEGCFSIGFIKQSEKKEQNRIRKGYKLGYQVFHEFAVTQGAKSLDSLQELKSFFGIGNIYINRRHDNHKEPLYRYVVRKREDLINIIIPFFQNNPLRTSKNSDFIKFSECLKMVNHGQHLEENGIIEIATIAGTMNRQKPRLSLIKILRDQTPNTSKGEDMVRTLWRQREAKVV